MNAFSKTQIDKLGDRLREGVISEDDLRMLDEYRNSFDSAHQIVLKAVHEATGILPVGRPEKSTLSIIDKLRRDKTHHARLSQVQDIVGCRIIADDLESQDRLMRVLEDLYPDATILDRRKISSHGYRAVHVVVRVEGLRVEVQVRSLLQHLWAEYCEKLADRFEHAVKYGGGPDIIRETLADLSRVLARIEGRWKALSPGNREVAILAMQAILDSQENLDSVRQRLKELGSGR